MPPVYATINANDPGNPHPNPIRCTRSYQSIVWNLTPQATDFASPPIEFPDPPPPGYDPWPGDPNVYPGAGPNQVQADLNHPLGVGGHEKYKYNVILADGTVFDPDIENTGSGPLHGPKKAMRKSAGKKVKTASKKASKKSSRKSSKKAARPASTKKTAKKSSGKSSKKAAKKR